MSEAGSKRDTDGGEIENVRVVVRVRPLSQKEKDAGYTQITSVDTVNGTISVKNPHASPNGEPPKEFTFDVVFDTDSRQLDIYNETARPIVDKVLVGYNGTILAYGQTGTGKTFTMEGDSSENELKGIIPNSFAHIFGHIAKAAEETRFLVRVAYVQIYNEEVRDLLSRDQTAHLEVKERSDIGVYIADVTGYVCNNADDMERIMRVGNKNRKVGSTAMNDTSSRSHAIFTITIENEHVGPDGKHHLKMGKLHLVDLAGSERQTKTGSTGLRLKEAAKINLSLSTLGNVISALVDGKSTHIPYRNSKLTRLLQDSLGGNSKTVMCANVGPADFNYEETVSTLRYASRAKNITNRARVNEDPKDAMLQRFQAEIEDLRKQLAADAAALASDEEPDLPVQGQDQDTTAEAAEAKENTAEEEQRLQEQLQAERHREALVEKLEKLQRKVLIGGENLLEKAEAQQQLLDRAAAELEVRRQREEALGLALKNKSAEIVDIEEKYSTLQEEAIGKTRTLKKVVSMYQLANAELEDIRHDHQREMEGILDSMRQLHRETKLQDTIIKAFIPAEFEEKLTSYMHWNEDIGEWQLKCVAYTGNNMRKAQPHATAGDQHEYQPPDLSGAYLSYSPEGGAGTSRTARARTARSSRSAASAGPT